MCRTSPKSLVHASVIFVVAILHSSDFFFCFEFHLVCHAHDPHPQSTLIYSDFHDMRNFPSSKAAKLCAVEKNRRRKLQFKLLNVNNVGIDPLRRSLNNVTWWADWCGHTGIPRPLPHQFRFDQLLLFFSLMCCIHVHPQVFALDEM